MKRAKIFIPSKTAMQSGRGKTKKWVLAFESKNTKTNPLMGWESGEDTLGEVLLKFSTKWIHHDIKETSVILQEFHKSVHP